MQQQYMQFLSQQFVCLGGEKPRSLCFLSRGVGIASILDHKNVNTLYKMLYGKPQILGQHALQVHPSIPHSFHLIRVFRTFPLLISWVFTGMGKFRSHAEHWDGLFSLKKKFILAPNNQVADSSDFYKTRVNRLGQTSKWRKTVHKTGRQNYKKTNPWLQNLSVWPHFTFFSASVV